MLQEYSFTCFIDDRVLNDQFGATVKVIKRQPLRTSPDGSGIELADVFITPVSGQHAYYESKTTWARTPATFDVPTREKSGSHNHFVVSDISGRGIYIVRDRMRREVHRRPCSLWDLGANFAAGVMRALRDFS
jgi:hypothetical protein